MTIPRTQHPRTPPRPTPTPSPKAAAPAPKPATAPPRPVDGFTRSPAPRKVEIHSTRNAHGTTIQRTRLPNGATSWLVSGPGPDDPKRSDRSFHAIARPRRPGALCVTDSAGEAHQAKVSDQPSRCLELRGKAPMDVRFDRAGDVVVKLPTGETARLDGASLRVKTGPLRSGPPGDGPRPRPVEVEYTGPRRNLIGDTKTRGRYGIRP